MSAPSAGLDAACESRISGDKFYVILEGAGPGLVGCGGNIDIASGQPRQREMPPRKLQVVGILKTVISCSLGHGMAGVFSCAGTWRHAGDGLERR